MPDATRPSGPGKLIHERRDAATEQEEIDEMLRNRAEAAGEEMPLDPHRDAHSAQRDAHVSPRSSTPHSTRGPGNSNPGKSGAS